MTEAGTCPPGEREAVAVAAARRLDIGVADIHAMLAAAAPVIAAAKDAEIARLRAELDEATGR
jgi:hypothetical protein